MASEGERLLRSHRNDYMRAGLHSISETRETSESDVQHIGVSLNSPRPNNRAHKQVWTWLNDPDTEKIDVCDCACMHECTYPLVC